jgi:hypothetical protein
LMRPSRMLPRNTRSNQMIEFGRVMVRTPS